MQKKPLVMRSPFYVKGLYDKLSLSALREEMMPTTQSSGSLAFGETPPKIF